MIDGGSTTERPLAWGVIGTGRIASAFVADLELTDSGSAVAVGSRSLGSADEFAARHGIPNRHASYADLAADPKVDAVYVATPHPMHRDSRGPRARGGQAGAGGEAVRDERLGGAGRSPGSPGSESSSPWRRCGPAFSLTWSRSVDLLAAGSWGRSSRCRPTTGSGSTRTRTRDCSRPTLGGGALLDLGIYPVSFASMVLGPPDRVAAVIDPAFTGVDAQVTMAFGYESGAQASLTCTLRARRRLARPSSAPMRGSRSTATSTGRAPSS